ncbi:hypothetical protein [Xanthomonas phage Olaya]|nr:hypothetical protein [Xanthomonas phage Olaya]QTZ82473.1 hypothetical protein [Xanthomonas phage Bolivar]QTZ82482.1 hypothetical protein [Xanthomonas phage Usaquen]QTZ82587.1 hypothetical protein [Xanthomonas phage Alcala]QTZ82640.1 hypothetical protein [Xanthomonas phage Fontebon]QTZ82680.1 hypothetical protein [Xanthomonas phage Soumapaz]CAA2366776.1 Phage protein [Xylella phage Usme]
MFNNNTLSTLPVPSAFIEQVSRRTVPLVDYEMGGVNVADASQGLNVKLWKLESNGAQMLLSADGVPAIDLFTRPNVSQVALAFDQNMRPHVAFMQEGVAWLWWYDSVAGAMVFSSFPGVTTPRLATDEKRPNQASNSDVILAYVRANNLYFRMQRERFQTEHLLKSAVNAELIAIGMNRGNRLQFRMRPTA